MGSITSTLISIGECSLCSFYHDLFFFGRVSISQGKHFIFTSSPAFVLRVHGWNEVIVSQLIPPAGGLLCRTQLIGSLAVLSSSQTVTTSSRSSAVPESSFHNFLKDSTWNLLPKTKLCRWFKLSGFSEQKHLWRAISSMVTLQYLHAFLKLIPWQVSDIFNCQNCQNCRPKQWCAGIRNIMDGYTQQEVWIWIHDC